MYIDLKNNCYQSQISDVLLTFYNIIIIIVNKSHEHHHNII